MPSEAGRRVPSLAGLSHRGVRASRGGGQGAVCELRMGRGAMRLLAPAGAERAGAAARGRDRGRLAACDASPAEQWPSERVGCASVQSGVRDGAATVVAPAAPSVCTSSLEGGSAELGHVGVGCAVVGLVELGVISGGRALSPVSSAGDGESLQREPTATGSAWGLATKHKAGASQQTSALSRRALPAQLPLVGLVCA